jgi:hypothetical protein
MAQGTNHVQNNYVGIREARGAVWLTKHGSDEIHSVSAGAFPADNGSDSSLYRQIVEGTVLAKREDLNLHYPCALDSAQGAVAAANVVPVADVLQFEIGQLVELPTSVAADAGRFRLVTAIDYDASEITLDGAAFSLSDGDALEVDGGRSVSSANGAVVASATLVLPTGHGTRFAIGDTLEFDGDTAKTIDNIAGDTITLSGAISIADGARVVSGSDGGYKISFKTVTIDAFRYTPQNTLIPTRAHGRVKESLVIGLTPTAKTALEGLIIFDQRTIA